MTRDAHTGRTDVQLRAGFSRRRLLALAGAGACSALVAGSGRPRAQSQERPHIYMVTYRGETEVERGFFDYLQAQGFEADFTRRDIDRDNSRLPELVEEIQEVQPDLVYTWGTTVTLGIAGRYEDDAPEDHIRDIPVVFALVSAPVQSGIIPERAKPGRNVTGAIHVVPPETQLRAMQAYRDFDRLGVLYNRNEDNSVVIVEDLEELADEMGFTLLAQPFAEDDQGRPTAEGVEDLVVGLKEQGADWLYYLPDTFLGTIYDRVSPAALDAGLPTFGAAELAVREGGALVGLVSRYYSVGQLAASKVIGVLRDGETPAEIPAETLSRFSLIINMEVAKELELYPPLAMLNYAEVLT
ncbi:ABC transporter substrate-binding protein [Fodinicurvata halophila]|uniref:ABC transporter substrate-binding protein n=1 Tax=Fodinicurvata halophila TaxID=1419723 RepID=A0ABV8UN00_9PROT